jgi:hypothetical protein
MPYVLCRMVLAQNPTVEITEDEYRAVGPARDVINQLISVEEKFDAVMENYVELEETVHNFGIRHLAFVPLHYEEMIAPLNVINRRVSNFLSSARLYRDSLAQHASNVLGRKHPAIEPLKHSLKDSTSQPIEYRIMEVVRNYAQHSALPIADISFDRHKDIDDQKRTTGFSNSVIPKIDTLEIAQGRDMPDDVRAALTAMGGQVNAMPLIRQYVEHIGSIHERFRSTIKQIETQSEKTMRDLLARYAGVVPAEKLIAVAVGFQHPNRTISDAEYLVEHRLEYFKYLRVKHLTAVNISRRYVPW